VSESIDAGGYLKSKTEAEGTPDAKTTTCLFDAATHKLNNQPTTTYLHL